MKKIRVQAVEVTCLHFQDMSGREYLVFTEEDEPLVFEYRRPGFELVAMFRMLVPMTFPIDSEFSRYV